MFQYAFGRALSLQLNVPLLIDKMLLEDHRPDVHVTNRNYELGIFKFNADFAQRNDVKRYHPFGANWTDKAIFHLRSRLTNAGFLPTLLAPGKITQEGGYSFDAEMFCAEPPVYAAGLFQSYRYFEDYERQIRQDFGFRNTLRGKGEDLAKRLREPNSVVLHVRRGDYLLAQNAGILKFVGLDYYRNAIERMRASISEPRFFVFSDDLNWCQSELPSLGLEAEFVDLPVPPSVPQHAFEMQLMSNCTNFIIANSTFSWWSAWLAGDRRHNVIAPEKWFADPTVNAGDLSPTDWLKL